MADRVDRSADIVALRALAGQYARGADTKDARRFTDAFTPDGCLVTSRGETLGPDVLVTLAPDLARYRATAHLVANHDIVFDGDHAARGTVYCQASHVRGDGSDSVYVMHIAYHDRYVRDAGRWRIAERRLELLWTEDRRLHHPST